MAHCLDRPGAVGNRLMRHDQARIAAAASKGPMDPGQRRHFHSRTMHQERPHPPQGLIRVARRHLEMATAVREIAQPATRTWP